MINGDSHFYLNLLQHLLGKKSVDTLIFNLAPYIALFVYESSRYINGNLPELQRLIKRQPQNEKVIAESRHRIKLLDGRKIQDFNEIAAKTRLSHKEALINTHAGILAPIKKYFQRDLGLYLYDNHLLCSTHIADINLGFETQNFISVDQAIKLTISTSLQSLSNEIGSYIRTLYNYLETSSSSLNDVGFKYNLDDSLFCTQDKKSWVFYDSIFYGPNKDQINFYLLTLLSYVNFLIYVLDNVVVDVPDTFFKIKYITFYQVTESCKKFREFYFPQEVLRLETKELIRKITDKRKSEFLFNKKFRNILVHYGIKDVPENKLDKTKRMYGIVEYFFEGKSLIEINYLLDNRIKEISQILEEHYSLTSRMS